MVDAQGWALAQLSQQPSYPKGLPHALKETSAHSQLYMGKADLNRYFCSHKNSNLSSQFEQKLGSQKLRQVRCPSCVEGTSLNM